MSDAAPGPVRFGDLTVRVVSGVVLATVAFVDLWLGGEWVAALFGLVTALMLWELERMVRRGGHPGEGPGVAVLVAGGVTAIWMASLGQGLWPALVPIAIGAGVLIVIEPRARGLWLAGGLIYVATAIAYLVVLRDQPDGFPLVVWLIAVVVAADVGAYFAGRAIGGPRLWPAVSPKKTWAGALGGIAAALAVAAGLALPGIAGPDGAAAALSLGLGLAIASQAGDLAESAVKRHFGVKDASRLIPGHGGLMDRLDGLVGALIFFACYDALIRL